MRKVYSKLMEKDVPKIVFIKFTDTNVDLKIIFAYIPYCKKVVKIALKNVFIA